MELLVSAKALRARIEVRKRYGVTREQSRRVLCIDLLLHGVDLNDHSSDLGGASAGIQQNPQLLRQGWRFCTSGTKAAWRVCRN